MDTVDASIPLQAQSGFDIGKMMSLAEMAQKMRMEQSAIQSQNALKNIFSNPGALDANGNPTPDTLRATFAADPAAGMQLRESTLANQVQDWHSKLTQTQIGKAKADVITGTSAAGISAYNAAITAGKTKADAIAAGAQARNLAAANSGGVLDENGVAKITSQPFDVSQQEILAGLNPDYVAQQNKVKEDQIKNTDPFEKEAADLYGKDTPGYKTALKRHVDKLDAPAHTTVNVGGPGGAKLEKGYEWDPANPGHEKPIPGGSREGVASLTPAMGDIMAALAAKGITLPVGLRSKEQQARLYDGLIRKFPDATPDEIADKIKDGQIDLKAQFKETQTAAGVAGRVDVAVNELKEFAPLALQASKDVPRGKFVPINKLFQQGETWTSDPKLKTLKIRVNALMNAYDQLAARGGTDQNKRAEARNLLLSADGPEAFEAGVQQFQIEAAAAQRAAVAATKIHRDSGHPLTNSKGWKLQRDAKGNYAYVSPDRKQAEEPE